MKRLAVLLALFSLPLVARAQVDDAARAHGFTYAFTCAAGTCTDILPTGSTDGTSGMALFRVLAIRVTVCADPTRTLSGAGTIRLYYYSPTAALWSRDNDLDLSVDASATDCQGAACRCQTFPDQEVMVRRGLVKPVPNGVTVSAGNLTIYVEGIRP